MPEHTRENADRTGKVSVRLEGFPNEQAAHDYIRSFIKPELAQQLIEDKARREGNDFIFERITCQWGDPPITQHCQGTGPCV